MPTSTNYTIADFLSLATSKLTSAGINTARLDSELLVENTLNTTRTWILAHDDTKLSDRQWSELCELLAKRANRQPIAYLVGHKEFYGRSFTTTPDTLIPRPETEQIIDYIDEAITSSPAEPPKTLLDVGTGTGCLATTAKLEHPSIDVTAVDISIEALAIARKNASNLGAMVNFYQSDLLDNVVGFYDIIVANLPYVDPSWVDLSPELAYEPSSALYANDGGLELIKKLLVQARDKLSINGQLILELDPRQSDDAINYAKTLKYSVRKTLPFMLVLQR